MTPHAASHYKKRLQRRAKRIAAAIAGAAILSSLALPGSILMPAVHAAAGAKKLAEENRYTHDKTHKISPTLDTAIYNRHTPRSFQRVLDITATAYAPGPHDNDQWGNKTYLGTLVRPGIIAVDPKLIPLGSTVYIEYPDGRGTYAIAEDVGGAIKGHRIDVAKWTVEEAEDFGIQRVKVYVIKEPINKKDTSQNV